MSQTLSVQFIRTLSSNVHSRHTKFVLFFFPILHIRKLKHREVCLRTLTNVKFHCKECLGTLFIWQNPNLTLRNRPSGVFQSPLGRSPALCSHQAFKVSTAFSLPASSSLHQQLHIDRNHDLTHSELLLNGFLVLSNCVSKLNVCSSGKLLFPSFMTHLAFSNKASERN